MSSIDIHIHHAESGDTYTLQIPLSESVLVDELRTQVEQYADIDPKNMILLFGPPFILLDPRKSLLSYGFGENKEQEKEVFLFCKTTLSRKYIPPIDIVLQPQQIRFPENPQNAPQLVQRSLPFNASPLQKAISEYEFQLQFHNIQASALAEGAQLRYDSITACITQIKTQSRSINAAISNMNDHCIQMVQMFGKFEVDCKNHQKKHSEVLENFSSDLLKLDTVIVSPLILNTAGSSIQQQILLSSSSNIQNSIIESSSSTVLQKDNSSNNDKSTDNNNSSSSSANSQHQKTLKDVVPITKLIKWAKEAERHVSVVQTRVLELESSNGTIQDGAKQESNKANVVIDEISLELESISKNIIKVLQDQLSTRDEMIISVKQVEDSISESINGGTDVEIVGKLEKILQKNVDSIQMMVDRDVLLLQAMEAVANLKSKSTKSLVERLRGVSIVESKVRDFQNNIEVLKEGLQVQHTIVSQIEFVKFVPDSYAAALVEISRRREFGRKYKNNIQRLADAVAQMREEEVSKRDTFFRRHGKFIPTDLIPSITKWSIPRLELSQRPFDENLPLIDQLPATAITAPIPSLNNNNNLIPSTTNTLTAVAKNIENPMSITETKQSSENLKEINKLPSSSDDQIQEKPISTEAAELVEEDVDIARLKIENMALKGDVKIALDELRLQLEKEHQVLISRYESRIEELELALKIKSTEKVVEESNKIKLSSDEDLLSGNNSEKNVVESSDSSQSQVSLTVE